MPKNEGIEDIKPKNEAVIDILPKNEAIIDTKPAIDATLKLEEPSQSYTVVLGQNMYVGLPFIPFYRDAGTVTQFSESGFDH